MFLFHRSEKCNWFKLKLEWWDENIDINTLVVNRGGWIIKDHPIHRETDIQEFIKDPEFRNDTYKNQIKILQTHFYHLIPCFNINDK